MTISPTESTAAIPGCLDGIKVIEIARFQAGPRAGMVLSDLGADVYKVEKPAPAGFGENRASPPMANGQSIYFAAYNRGKKSLCLDLRSDVGMAILKELIAEVDVVIENFRPGTFDSMGLGFDTLQELNPGIILLSISGFGQKGPYRERPGFDSLGQAMSGLSMLTGQLEGRPIPAASSVVDRVTALHGAIGVLAALRHRESSGRGQWIDVCLLDSALSLVEIPNSYYLSTGEEGGETPRPVYRTRDGWIVIAANARTVAKLMTAVGVGGDAPEDFGLYAQPAGSGVDAAKQERNPLGQALIDWCEQRDTDEISRILESHGVPYGPVRSTPEVVADPHMWERELMVSVPDDLAGDLFVPGLSIKFSDAPGRLGGVPRLGEHSEEALAGLLGYGADRISELRTAGVI